MARLPAMRVKMMTAGAFMEMSVLCSVTLHRVGKVEMISRCTGTVEANVAAVSAQGAKRTDNAVEAEESGRRAGFGLIASSLYFEF